MFTARFARGTEGAEKSIFSFVGRPQRNKLRPPAIARHERAGIPRGDDKRKPSVPLSAGAKPIAFPRRGRLFLSGRVDRTKKSVWVCVGLPAIACSEGGSAANPFFLCVLVAELERDEDGLFTVPSTFYLAIEL